MLRTLPAPARRRLPWRLRHPLRWLTMVALVAGAVALATVYALDNAQRGKGLSTGIAGGPALQPVRLSQQAVHDYNPFGTEEEDPAGVGNILDGNPNTSWSTQQYVADTLAPKPGTGVYVDAPGVEAREVEVRTPTPGMSLAVYGANQIEALPFGDRTPLQKRGWTRLARSVVIGQRTKIALRATGHPYSHYLFWITKLPSESPSAEISEVTLLR